MIREKRLEIKWESQHGTSSKDIENYLITHHLRKNKISSIKNFGTKIIVTTLNSEKGLEKELERVFKIRFWVTII